MEFLGTAIAIPLRPDGRGGLVLVRGVEAVEDHIRAIISSGKGEHPFEPWFGWPLDVFMPVQDIDVVCELVREAIIDAEDRIDHDTLQVRASLGDEGVLDLSIFYSIRGQATPRTLQTGFRMLN